MVFSLAFSDRNHFFNVVWIRCRCKICKSLQIIRGTMDYFISEITEKEIKQEKTKARKLRASQWWKRKRANGICFYCGRVFQPGELTMDHIVPLVRGGKTTKGNIAASCKECNTKKKYLLPMEWDEYIRKLRER